MSRDKIYDKLTEIFIDVFDIEDIHIVDSTTSKDVVGWDSLTHITLIGVIEDEFNIKFDMVDLPKMKDVGTMVTLIEGLV